MVTPAVVAVRCQGATGAGFFLDARHVLTNSHVACQSPFANAITLGLADGRTLHGSVEKRDTWLDLALIRVSSEERVATLGLGDATEVEVGDRVVLVGSPRGLDFTVHEGIVSNTGRSSLGIAYLQVDANINPGNSGGPLLDGQGRVVGIVSMSIHRSSGLGLVLPVNYVYAGPGAFIQDYHRPLGDRWGKLLSGVEEADRREVAAMADAFRSDNGIVAARIDRSSDRITAVFVHRGPEGSASSLANLYLEQEGRHFCHQAVKIREWTRWEDWAPDRDRDDRYWTWFRKNNLGRDLQLGAAEMYLCPTLSKQAPFSVVLGSGDKQAERVSLSAYDGDSR